MSDVKRPIARFYILPQGAGIDARFDVTAALVEKAVKAQYRVLILCADEAMCTQLDKHLWAYKAESFLPHCRLDDELAAYARIWLAYPPARVNEAEVIINLSLDPKPDIPRHCCRLFDIITQHSDILHVGRQRYAYYRHCGIEPQTHILPPHSQSR